MIKKSTGVKYTPAEFRALNQCVFCGKAESIEYGGRCKVCSQIDYKNCEVCEIVLREGLHKFYTYDTREIHRDGVDFNPIKELVREFTYHDYPSYEKHSDTLCKGCIGWEEKVKDICWMCDNDFTNSKENYKLNGNMCELCSARFENIDSNDKETNDN